MRLSCDRRQEHNIHYTAIDWSRRMRMGMGMGMWLGMKMRMRTLTIVNAIWRRSRRPGSKHWAVALRSKEQWGYRRGESNMKFNATFAA